MGVATKLVIGLVRLESLKPGFVDSRSESLISGFAIPLGISMPLYCNNLAVIGAKQSISFVIPKISFIETHYNEQALAGFLTWNREVHDLNFI